MPDLVTVGMYSHANQASMARLRLDMAGIESVLVDVEAITMDWLLGPALGQIKLPARADDAARLRSTVSAIGPTMDEG